MFVLAGQAMGVHITLRMRLECTILRRGNRDQGEPVEVLNEVVVDRGSGPYLTKIECWERDHLITKVCKPLLGAGPLSRALMCMQPGRQASLAVQGCTTTCDGPKVHNKFACLHNADSDFKHLCSSLRLHASWCCCGLDQVRARHSC